MLDSYLLNLEDSLYMYLYVFINNSKCCINCKDKGLKLTLQQLRYLKLAALGSWSD